MTGGGSGHWYRPYRCRIFSPTGTGKYCLGQRKIELSGASRAEARRNQGYLKPAPIRGWHETYRSRRPRVILSILPSLRHQLWRKPLRKLTRLTKPGALLLAESVAEFKSGPAERLSPLVFTIPSEQTD
jgi:hypothetical protein